ncbi:hypothetical protein MMPV_008518 [Pyropia vietnamensis]
MSGGGSGGDARSPRPTASAAMAVPGRSSTTDAAVAAEAAAVAASGGGGGGGGGGSGDGVCDDPPAGLGVVVDGDDGADLCEGGVGRIVGGNANLASSLMLSHVSSHVAVSPVGGAAAGSTVSTPRRLLTTHVLADVADALGSVAPRGSVANAGGGSASSAGAVAEAGLPTMEAANDATPRLRRFVSHSYGEAGAHMRRRSGGWGGGGGGGGGLLAGSLLPLDEADVSFGGADLSPGVAGSAGARLSASVGGAGLMRGHSASGPRQPAAVSWSGGWGTSGGGGGACTRVAPRVPRRRGRGLSRVNRAVEVRWVPAPAAAAAGAATVGGTAPPQCAGTGGAPLRPAGRWAVESVARLVPDPSPYGVLVSVSAAAVCDSDLDLLRGEYHPRELVGRVIAVGTRVTHVAVGDAVAAGGTLPPERTPPPSRVAGTGTPTGAMAIAATATAASAAAGGRPPRQRQLGVAVDGGWAAYVLLPDVAVHPVADRLLSPWGVAAGRLAVLSAAVAALPAAPAVARGAALHEGRRGSEVLVLASAVTVADVPLVALLLGRAGWVPLFHGDGGGGAAAVGASLARLPAGAGGLGVLSTDGLLSRYAPLAARQAEGNGGSLPPLMGALDLTSGTSDGLAAALAVLAPRGVLVLAPSRTGKPATGTPVPPTCSHLPAAAQTLPLDAVLAKGLTIVGIPPDAGDYATGLEAAADLSDTVPVAALGVRQVPLGGAPPVLAAAAAGCTGGGRMVLVPPPMVAAEARRGRACASAVRGAGPTTVSGAYDGFTVDDEDDGLGRWEVDPPPVSPKMSPCASPSFFPPSLAL